MKVVAATTLGEGAETVSLKPGDVVYTLHYLGEGYDLIWFNGRVLKDQTSYEDLGEIPWAKQFVVLELPTTEWWVLIRNQQGEVEWTSEPWNFGNKDACG